MRARLSALVSLCIFGGIISMNPDPAVAQLEERAGFAISMDSQELSGRPGSRVEASFNIISTGIATTSRYLVRPRDIGQTDSGNMIPVEPGEGARSCAGWIEVQERVEVAAGATREVPFTITIPPGATGCYYAYITIQHVSDVPEEQMVLTINPTLTVKVELTIPGMNRLSLNVSNLEFRRDAIEGRPGTIVEVKNDGNVKTSVEGDILLYASEKSFPLRVDIPMDRGGKPPVVYPGLSKKLACPFVKTPPPATYRAQVRLKIAGRWRTNSEFDVVIPQSGLGNSVFATPRSRSEYDLDISVEPPYIEVTLPPGATRTVSLRVQNRDSVEAHTQASVVNVYQETNGFMTFAELPEASNQWVTVIPSDCALKPKSARSFRVSITAPENGREIENHCAVRISGSAGVDEGGWRSELEVGVPVLSIPPGAPPAKIEIAQLKTLRPGPEKNPMTAVLVVQNVGGHMAKVAGEMILERSLTGEIIQSMHLGGPDSFLFPLGEVREYRMPLSYLDRDEFRLKAEVSIIGQPKSKQEQEITFVCTQGPN